jgi:hypothetical protein
MTLILIYELGSYKSLFLESEISVHFNYPHSPAQVISENLGKGNNHSAQKHSYISHSINSTAVEYMLIT